MITTQCSPLRLLLAVSLFTGTITSAVAQSIPEERRITHREKSLGTYDPFSAEELWKRIPIPPSPALTPEQALESFQTAPGFRIELVAAEPLVVDPIMFEFDPDGRIWAVEFRGWMRDIEGTGEADPTGQVVVLEDTDGDGVMDKSTVFLDRLVMPRTIAFVKNGVLVAEPPNLWFCQDLNGDLKCDRKVRVGEYGRPGNPEHTENGLMHGLDNWMHSVDSRSKHRFRDGKLITAPAYDRGQWGITQDDYGRLFYCYENRPLHGDLIPYHYAFRNRNLDVGRRTPGLDEEILPRDGEVHPIRVTPGITLGGHELREDGTLRTFTIAAGPSIYRGTQFPDEFYGSAVIPEAAGNLVRLAPISGDGVHLKAANAFEKLELLASTDERFRPVCSRTGPDGALYVCDLYRGIIEHVIFMMPYLRHQILSRGLDKPIGLGRIYRIVHEDKPPCNPPRMSGQSSPELVAHLAHPNGWWRDTAQRLLVERQAKEVAPALRRLAVSGDSHAGRLHALWTLEGIGELDDETIRAASGDDHEMIRATAIRLSELLPNRTAPGFTEEDSPMVRLQQLLTLGEFEGEQAEATMARILAKHPSPVFRTAAVSGLGGRELEFIERLVADAQWTASKEKRSWVLETLATAVMNEGNPARVGRLLELIEAQDSGQAWRVEHMLFGVLDSRLGKTRWPEPIHLASRPDLLDKIGDQQGAKLLRIVTWPGDSTERVKAPVIPPLTESQRAAYALGESVYHATCHSCHKSNGQGAIGQAPALADSEWVNGDPDTLTRIVLHGLRGPVEVKGRTWDMAMPGLGHSAFLNDERLAAVLTYVRRAWGNYGDPVEVEAVARVRAAHPDRIAMWTVESLKNPAEAQDGEAATDPLEKYRGALTGGEAGRGKALFHGMKGIRCQACHRVGHMGGGFIGPDLTAVGSRSDRRQLLESLILPSKVIAEGFRTVGIQTKSGEFHSGIIISEDEEIVEIGLAAGGSTRVPKGEILSRTNATVSSMPPVGQVYSPQQIADLVAYLESLKKE